MSSLLRTYFNEAEEIIDTLIDNLELVKDSPQNINAETLNEIMRKMHTMKGNSYSVGYMKVGDIFHKLEEIFVKVRNMEIIPSSEMIVDVISTVHMVRDILSALSAEDRNSDEDVQFNQTIVSMLDKYLSGERVEKVVEWEGLGEGFGTEKESNGEALGMGEMGRKSKKGIAGGREGIKLESRGNELETKEEKLDDIKGFLSDKITRKEILDELSQRDMAELKKYINQGKMIVLSFLKLSMEDDFDARAKGAMDEIRKRGFEIVSTFTRIEGDNIVFNFIIVPVRDDADIKDIENILQTQVLWSGAQKRMEDIKGSRVSLRVDISDIDKIMNIIGDMVIAKNAIQSSLMKIIDIARSIEAEQRLRDSIAEMERRIRELQDIVLEIRMIPLNDILKGVVRDVQMTARQLRKIVNVEQQWGNIDIDAEIARRIRNALLHIARNAVAHGIEPPDERIKLGKKPDGKVRIRARKEGGYIIIEIQDDGKGIDPKNVVKKYLDWVKLDPEVAAKYRLGNLEEDFKRADGTWIKEKVFQILFLPGFSTRESADRGAGRGAGLYEVRKEIEEGIKGKIEVRSEVGEGTTFILKIPTAKIVVGVVICSWRDEKYAIPISAIWRTRIFYRGDKSIIIKTIQGREFAVVKDMQMEVKIPLITPDEILGRGRGSLPPDKFFILILGGETETEGITDVDTVGSISEGGRVGLVVEDILDIKDTVMKNFDEEIIKVKGVSAIVEEIDSDGRREIIPVIDVLNIPYSFSY